MVAHWVRRLGISGLLGDVPIGSTGMVPGTRRLVMKLRALDEALRMVSKAASDPRVDPDQSDRLRKAQRELEVVARSGKLDERRIFLAVSQIAAVLLEVVEHEATRR